MTGTTNQDDRGMQFARREAVSIAARQRRQRWRTGSRRIAIVAACCAAIYALAHAMAG